jgi:hypothetical protein
LSVNGTLVVDAAIEKKRRMKKTIIGLLTVTVLTGCYKERTCVCRDPQDNVLPNESIRRPKKEMKERCDAIEVNVQAYYGGGSCELK